TVTLVREVRGRKTTKRVPDGSGALKLDIDPSEGWQLIATKKGFRDLTIDLSFSDGKPEMVIRIELVEEGKDAPPATPTPAAPAPAAPAPGAPKPAQPAAAAPATPPAAPDKGAPATGSGTINMNSIPVSKVVLDGKPLGSTPKVGVSVPAG